MQLLFPRKAAACTHFHRLAEWCFDPQVDADVSGHIGKAINLWDRLLAARGGDQMALVLRMPQATLHAALQVQHYVNLLGNVHPEAATYSTNIVWRLMRGLKNQVSNI